MNERKTTSILQRLPVILAVTAASYGLQFPPGAAKPGETGRTPAKQGVKSPMAQGTVAPARKA